MLFFPHQEYLTNTMTLGHTYELGHYVDLTI